MSAFQESAATAPLFARVQRRLAPERLQVPLPLEAAGRLLALCADRHLDGGQLIDLLQRDRDLSAPVLRAANSAAFTPAEEIQTFRASAHRLGLARIREISMCVLLGQRLFPPVGPHAAHTRLWRHSARACDLARRLAAGAEIDGERAALAALLHDVGRPFVLRVALEEARASGEVLADAERESLLDALHAPVGAALARGFGLPAEILPGIEHHHDPEAAGEHARLAHLVRLADAMAHAAEVPELARELPANPSIKALGLDNAHVVALLAAADEVCALAEALS